jgi:hypothetical protein
MSVFADHIEAEPVATDYALLVECMLAPIHKGGEAVGGIEIYLLDAEGHNAFSFLLNSHHRLFNEGNLGRMFGYDDERADLVHRITEVVIEALRIELGVKMAG